MYVIMDENHVRRLHSFATVVCYLSTGTNKIYKESTLAELITKLFETFCLPSSLYPKSPSLPDCRVLGLTRKASCDLYPEVWIQFGIRACVCLQNSLPDPKLRCFVT